MQFKPNDQIRLAEDLQKQKQKVHTVQCPAAEGIQQSVDSLFAAHSLKVIQGLFIITLPLN